MATRRFDSQFDPEDLAKITHRGLKPRSKKEEKSVTPESLTSLKTVAQNEQTLSVAIHRVFDRMFGGMSGFFKGLTARPQRKVLQCENYGHVLKAGWHGDFPMCDDCGHKITALDQVRSSNLKNPTVYEDPHSNNNGRKYVT